MTHDDHKSIRQGDQEVGQDLVGRLIRSSGPREPVPDELAERVRSSVYRSWREAVRKPVSQPRWQAVRPRFALWFATPLAAAAAVLLAMNLGYLPGQGAGLNELARFEVLRGEIMAFDANTTRIDDPGSQSLKAGYAVATGVDGRASLTLAGGQSIRLDHGTRIILAAADNLVLERGAVYLDSGLQAGAGSVRIDTPFGVARDIGTQFEARLTESSLRIRVREGRVQLSPSEDLPVGEFEIEVGREFSVDNGGLTSQRAVSVHGPEWSWTRDLAPSFVLEGQSLGGFLAWISRENGWQLSYSDPVIERSATTNVLHGSIEGLYSEEALGAVLLVTGIQYDLQNGVLTIGI